MDWENVWTISVVAWFMVTLISSIILWSGEPKDIGYKQGYIDAKLGVPSYELVVNERGETVWKGERPKSND